MEWATYGYGMRALPDTLDPSVRMQPLFQRRPLNERETCYVVRAFSYLHEPSRAEYFQ